MLKKEIRYLKGIGEKRAQTFAKLGITTLEDLIRFYPRDYEDRTRICSISQLIYGQTCCVRATAVEGARTTRIPGGRTMSRLTVCDDGGAISVTFFNQKYSAERIVSGKEYIFYGRVGGRGSRLELINPEFEEADKPSSNGSIVPVYRLTAGLGRTRLMQAVKTALDACEGSIEETLPRDTLLKYRLMDLKEAIKVIHFPPTWDALAEARRRMVFEELFFFTLGLALMREGRSKGEGFAIDPRPLEEYISLLPFEMTPAQRRCTDEVLSDMASGRLMNRLVQGDVGSGKTAVAAAAAYCTVRSGKQCALMAPTEILARQHYNSLKAQFEKAGLETVLLTGGMGAAAKREANAVISSQKPALIIGTHALISANVEFSQLALVITDEQHRFGVGQRAQLAAKGAKPHVLVMSATPIPRTLALIMYGDLDVSILDGMPPGRIPVKTYSVDESYTKRIYDFIRRTVVSGRQVYVVCPAVEENEEMPLKSVEEYGERLKTRVFPDLRVECIHGKMRPAQKDAVMNSFSSGEADILVATTVIEVGVDVPNATLMVIENAERFGLSQLHQLRGRVGRGGGEAFCVLMSDSKSEGAKDRLKVMCKTNDGFKIAEEDLRIRGPGDFFGSRQHGLPEFRIADISYDTRLLSQAQDAARAALEKLSAPEGAESRRLIEKVRELFDRQAVFN